MEPFKALVVWPSAPLTDFLVRKSLSSLKPPPTVLTSLPEDLPSFSGNLLQWSTYDAIHHDLTHSAPPSLKVLSSSYVIRKALIRKHYLARCIYNYLVKHKESALGIATPRTWDIELSFADELDEMWSDDLFDLGQELDKAGMADRGMGIRLFHTKEDLMRIFEEFEQGSDDEEAVEEEIRHGPDSGVMMSQLRHFVIQEYLFNLLVLDPAEVPLDGKPKPKLQDLRGHKFHLRVYCVASGAVTVYMYDRILALFSAVPYSNPSEGKDSSTSSFINEYLAAHLTNTSLQTERGEAGVRLLDELIGSHILSSRLGASAMQPQQQQVRTRQPRPPRAIGQMMDVEQIRVARKKQDEQAQRSVFTAEDIEDIKSQISEVLAETFKAALDMSVHFQPLPNAFELYGVDFLVTNVPCPSLPKFQVNLLEVNSEPAIELTGPRLTWILEDLFRAIGRVCVAPSFGASQVGDGKWEVGQTRELLRKCLDMEVRGAQGCLTKMAANTSNLVFDDLFTISAVDKEGKKFDRVSRLYAHSKNYDMDLTLDYNIELYPLQKDESFTLALASSLSRGHPGTSGGAEDDKDRDVWRPDGKGQRGLEEDYDYVMYGKVYRFDSGAQEIVTAYASFGGLLMSLTGSFRHMTSIVLGDPMYILLRK
ncbi:uncharacterized protein LAESUDRAFT_743194 [Laetiporus sulphureus 93-53]|uniref:DNA-directed RNA polymerases I, II, and III subunit RPABC3 n=1 Tax=Laetiporus sulphureus 93-53 TaxID=1314785 RepID=A0A165EEE2_9APHY|nr:uncharacterized protein LAESUDRAFT_743194 [Laetiporus sulphureus 93-53]KZT06869.1 hypothetical protein LAESUDRAFT_743194 [Laetiporus sulphureus 93-53]